MWSGEKIGTGNKLEGRSRNLNRAGTGWELHVNSERSPFTQLPLFERRTYQNGKERRHICGLYPCQYFPNLMWQALTSGQACPAVQSFSLRAGWRRLRQTVSQTVMFYTTGPGLMSRPGPESRHRTPQRRINADLIAAQVELGFGLRHGNDLTCPERLS